MSFILDVLPYFGSEVGSARIKSELDGSGGLPLHALLLFLVEILVAIFFLGCCALAGFALAGRSYVS